MPLYVTLPPGIKVPITFSMFEEKKNCILCKFKSQDQEGLVEIKYPLDIVDSENPDEFQIFLLVKNDLNENDIFQVFDKSPTPRRIGWCFPIQALNSTDHSFADNRHFLPYAYVAANKLISECPDNSNISIPSIDDTEPVEFTDFFPDSIAILIIHLPSIVPDTNFNLEKWVASLFIHGYIPLGTRPPIDLIWLGEKPEGKEPKILLKPISSALDISPFISTVLTDLIAFERNNLLVFFYLYQVIEFLMEKVYLIEQEVLIDELLKVRNDSVKSKDILSDIQGLSSEKKRINRLINCYCKTLKNSDYNDLLESCNKFHKENDDKEYNDIGEALYKVRNVLFHQYRNVSSTQQSVLSDIIPNLIYFVINMLFNFSNDKAEKRYIEKIPESSK